jgi:hypothetical protein
VAHDDFAKRIGAAFRRHLLNMNSGLPHRPPSTPPTRAGKEASVLVRQFCVGYELTGNLNGCVFGQRLSSSQF